MIGFENFGMYQKSIPSLYWVNCFRNATGQWTFFSLGYLLPHFRPCDDTLENSCCQVFKSLHWYEWIIIVRWHNSLEHITWSVKGNSAQAKKVHQENGKCCRNMSCMRQVFPELFQVLPNSFISVIIFRKMLSLFDHTIIMWTAHTGFVFLLSHRHTTSRIWFLTVCI